MNIADSLAARLEATKPLRVTIPAVKQDDKTLNGVKNRLSQCLKTSNKLQGDKARVVYKRKLKHDTLIKANRELRFAESNYEKLGNRANEHDNQQINAIRNKVKYLVDSIKLADKAIKSLESDCSYALKMLSNVRHDFARLQSAIIMRDALIKSGLLDAVQQSIVLFMAKDSGMGFSSIKEDLTRAFFDAVLTNNKLPSFDTTLKAVDSYLD